jgi:AbrB family looped-hinge helix DNA binding protein
VTVYRIIYIETNSRHWVKSARACHLNGIMPPMRTTIDKAGRVVIPAPLRERVGFTPGSALEITEDEHGIRIERVAPGPHLVKVGRRLVARPTVPADELPVVDIGAVIEDERNRWP